MVRLNAFTQMTILALASIMVFAIVAVQAGFVA